MLHSGHPSTLAVSISPLTGRSYRATCDLPQGSCVLDVPTPYADTVYKKFRKEVCAECWRYELGRTAFLTCRDFAEAGLWFCDAGCHDTWLEREGEETVGLLKRLETARMRKEKGKTREDDAAPAAQVTQDSLARVWEDVVSQETRAKTFNRWKMIQLDDFEADLARYVLMALIQLYRESRSNATSLDALEPADPSQPPRVLHFRGATWSDFAALQSGELLQASKFPELLNNWIRIYQVLKSRFSSRASPPTVNNRPSTVADSTITTVIDLSAAITPQNVRTALGVDPGNSFGIWQVPVTEESEGLGFGVYPIPSFFNHRESPLLSAVFVREPE